VSNYLPVNPMHLSLNDNVIDLWIVDLQVSDQILQRAYDILSDDELQRAQRFRFPADSRRFVIARSTLRKILARYLQTAPQSLEFEYTEHGKPKLTRPLTNVRFNASRSREKALIACTMGREVGVDIEWIHRDLEIDDLARRFFTAAENEKLQTFSAEHRHEAFLRCWTCKEAFVKAVGKGLSVSLNTFDVSLGLGNPGPASSTPIERFVVNGWSLIPTATNAVEGYISALAVEGKDLGVTIQAWVESER
jgi:4'-phosphopantetheinyl transferase